MHGHMQGPMHTSWRPGGLLACCALIAVICALPTVGQSQGKSEQEFYRCKDANGQRRFGSALPPECVGRDAEVLNSRGTVIRTLEGETTRGQRLQREADTAEQQRLVVEQKQRDKVLIETYLSVEEI